MLRGFALRAFARRTSLQTMLNCQKPRFKDLTLEEWCQTVGVITDEVGEPASSVMTPATFHDGWSCKRTAVFVSAESQCPCTRTLTLYLSVKVNAHALRCYSKVSRSSPAPPRVEARTPLLKRWPKVHKHHFDKKRRAGFLLFLSPWCLWTFRQGEEE